MSCPIIRGSVRCITNNSNIGYSENKSFIYIVSHVCRCDFFVSRSCPNVTTIGPGGCSPEVLSAIECNVVCGFLNETNGPFRDCIQHNEYTAREFYDICVFDVCANQNDSVAFKQAACETLAVFADYCEELGYREPWRDLAFCRK